jgi:hypothetical protein
VWEPDEWKRFVAWAIENGASSDYEDEYVEWWDHGKLHRENGPAIVWSGGYDEWCVNGKRHREDGPAVVWGTGRREWWRNGIRFTDGTFADEVYTFAPQ